MTTKKQTAPEDPGARVIHILRSGLTLPGIDGYAGRIGYRGETFRFSGEEVEGTRDRNGDSWLDMTEEDQIARWGTPRFANGPAPEELVAEGIGSDDVHGVVYRRYTEAVRRAHEISDPWDRALALREARARFGQDLNPSNQLSVKYPEGRS